MEDKMVWIQEWNIPGQWGKEKQVAIELLSVMRKTAGFLPMERIMHA